MDMNGILAEKRRIEKVLPAWIELLALPGKPFGRFKMHQAQEPPWLLYASQQMLSLAIDSGYWRDLDENRRSQWLDVLLSTQDPDSGLFFCPVASKENAHHPEQWDRVESARPITVKLIKRLKEIEVTPKYPPPEAERFCPTLAELPEHLAKLPWDTKPYGAGSQAGFWGSFRLNELAAGGRDMHDDAYVDTILLFLESSQNPETGLWSDCGDWVNGVNGMLKSLNIYRMLNRPLPRSERIVETILGNQLDDGTFGKGSCSTWNALVLLDYIAAREPIDKERVRRAVCRAADSQSLFLQPDGLYSAHPEGCLVVMGMTRLCQRPEPVGDVHGTGHARGILALCEKIFNSTE